MSETNTPRNNKWHIGCQNDETFIINTPPRPVGDDPWHDRPDGPTFVMSVERLDSCKVITEHNRVVSELESELFRSLEGKQKAESELKLQTGRVAVLLGTIKERDLLKSENGRGEK